MCRIPLLYLKRVIFIILPFILFISSCRTPGQWQPFDLVTTEILAEKYDAEEALTLMLFNSYAYGRAEQVLNYKTIRMIIDMEIVKQKRTKDWKLIWLGVTEDYDNLAYVTKKKGNEPLSYLTLSIRGTAFNVENIFQDIDVARTRLWPSDKNSKARISEGIYLTFERIKKLTSEVFHTDSKENLTISELIRKELKDNNQVVLNVTGHSLGGALSVVVSLSLLEEFRQELSERKLILKNYNFAGQTVGNRDFIEYFSRYSLEKSMDFSHFRVVIPEDSIPFAYNRLKELASLYKVTPFIHGEVLLVTSVLNDLIVEIDYQQSSPLIQLEGNKAYPSECSIPVTDLRDYFCMVFKNHKASLYVKLLRETLEKQVASSGF